MLFHRSFFILLTHQRRSSYLEITLTNYYPVESERPMKFVYGNKSLFFSLPLFPVFSLFLILVAFFFSLPPTSPTFLSPSPLFSLSFSLSRLSLFPPLSTLFFFLFSYPLFLSTCLSSSINTCTVQPLP